MFDQQLTTSTGEWDRWKPMVQISIAINIWWKFLFQYVFIIHNIPQSQKANQNKEKK